MVKGRGQRFASASGWGLGRGSGGDGLVLGRDARELRVGVGAGCVCFGFVLGVSKVGCGSDSVAFFRRALRALPTCFEYLYLSDGWGRVQGTSEVR